MVEFAGSDEDAWKRIPPLLLHGEEPTVVVQEGEPDTKLYAMPGPPQLAPSWVIETWRNAAEKRAANERLASES